MMSEDLMLKFEPTKGAKQISYGEKVMLIGSCFTEHIGNYLKEHKFDVLQNPNGILFDTLSVSRTLNSYVENKKYTAEDIFQYNELWQSWQHHSLFSIMDKGAMLQQLNTQQEQASQFIATCDWLIITLGSSYAYRLKKETAGEFATTDYVANCHKVPGQWFEKYLIPIDEQIAKLDQTIYRLRRVNPKLKVIFTISPVRHIRDGVVENNRSKARLIETVHHLANKFIDLHYFPAYEMLIDVLRDYRFYDVDMVHPNYLGTSKVIQAFVHSFVTDDSKAILEQVRQIVIARKHKAFQPNTVAHKKFLLSHLEKTQQLLQQFPILNLQNELDYFADVVV